MVPVAAVELEYDDRVPPRWLDKRDGYYKVHDLRRPHAEAARCGRKPKW